jgi:hypothetical protein
MSPKLSRRRLLESALWSTMLPTVAAAAPRSPLVYRSRPEKLLIVFAANGGASLIDSFLPVLSSSTNSQLRTYTEQQLDTLPGSAFRCVKSIPYRLGVPVETRYQMREFLAQHSQDMVLFTQTGTSVNHLIGQQRSLNGNGINRGRTLMEAVAESYGRELLLPNVNMALGGYALPGSDPSLPRYAQAEAVADALLFPLALHRDQLIEGRADGELLAAARDVRTRLEQSSRFYQDHKLAAMLQDLLRYRSEIPRLEAAQLLESLMLLDQARSGRVTQPMSENNQVLERVRDKFPAYATDPLEAQTAMAFLLLRYGLSTSVTIGLDEQVRFRETGTERELLHLPLAFDWSHNSHVGAQNSMWRRVLHAVDRLVQLLKAEDYLGVPEFGRIWDRSLVYVATEFGRDKAKVGGSGHDLNNGHVLLSPLLRGNQVLGGLDEQTGLTYGFDPATGRPDPARTMQEGDQYSLILQALGVSFPGQRRYSTAVVRG